MLDLLGVGHPRPRAQAGGRQALESPRIHPNVGLGREAEAVAVDEHDAGPERLGDEVEGAAEPGPGLAVVGLRPEQAGQGVAPLRPAGHRQVDQQRQRTPQVQLDRPPIALQAGRAQHEQPQTCHGSVPSRTARH